MVFITVLSPLLKYQALVPLAEAIGTHLAAWEPCPLHSRSGLSTSPQHIAGTQPSCGLCTPSKWPPGLIPRGTQPCWLGFPSLRGGTKCPEHSDHPEPPSRVLW